VLALRTTVDTVLGESDGGWKVLITTPVFRLVTVILNCPPAAQVLLATINSS